MKPTWISIIAIFILISHLMGQNPLVKADFSGPTMLQSIAHFQTVPLQNNSHKFQDKTLHIAQGFFPIVVIAEITNALEGFAHYISIHKLYRQNEYFLLI
jgi:hypothetical protein